MKSAEINELRNAMNCGVCIVTLGDGQLNSFIGTNFNTTPATATLAADYRPTIVEVDGIHKTHSGCTITAPQAINAHLHVNSRKAIHFFTDLGSDLREYLP